MAGKISAPATSLDTEHLFVHNGPYRTEHMFVIGGPACVSVATGLQEVGMMSHAYAPHDEFDLPVHPLFAPPRVLDQHELDRIAHPRLGERGYGPATRHPGPADRRRPVRAGRKEAARGPNDPSGPLGNDRFFTVRIALRVALGAMMVAVLLLLLFMPSADAGRGPVPPVPHVVQPGDTLWSLAQDYTRPGGDVRATVAVIRAGNEMSSGQLVVGDVIEVPVGEIPGWRSPTEGG